MKYAIIMKIHEECATSVLCLSFSMSCHWGSNGFCWQVSPSPLNAQQNVGGRNEETTYATNSVVSALQVLYFYQALPKSYQESLLTQCQRCKRPISLRSFCNAVFFSFSNAACTREKSDSASPSCSSKLRSRARCCFSFASWSGETDGISTRQATFLQVLLWIMMGHEEKHTCTLH